MKKNQIGNIVLIVLGLVFIIQWRIWLKLVGLVLLGLGVFRLVRSRNQEAPQQEAPVIQERDAELTAQIKGLQGKIRLLKAACFLVGALTLIAFVAGSWVLGIVFAIVFGILMIARENKESDLKSYVADNIARQALEDVFEVTEYKPFGHIDRHYVKGAYFGISSFDDMGGSDYVKGFYKGLPIEMCDLTLTSRETRLDEDGNEEEYDLEVFRGLWLICDFQKELSASLRLWERGKLGKLVGGKGIKTENEAFNKYFHIESDIEQEAFYILTPHMMEYILEMDRKANGETHMRFDRGGKVQIAIKTDRDAFEVGRGRKDAAKLRQKFVQEIRYITDLIDELRLVDTLYKK